MSRYGSDSKSKVIIHSLGRLSQRATGHVWESFRKGDMVLLLLCLILTVFGCLMIASTKNAVGFTRYVVVQCAAAALGVIMFAVVSSIDVEFMSEHRNKLVIFNILLLLMLIPFGTDKQTGNRSWLDIPMMPVDIQPAEICKITLIIILASVMGSHQNSPSSPKAVFHSALHMILLLGLNMGLSRDLGVSLIFVFIFIGMALAGGISFLWFGLGIGAITLSFPIWWRMLGNYQRNRILILFDPTIDPLGVKERYHSLRAIKSLTGGGITGQGLFEGTRTQTEGALFAQHTDFIFAAIGEELGLIGCLLVLIMLALIIARCIWVGTRSPDYVRKLICFGAASALIFQVFINVGMCLGVAPVIGLTLPFVSYGGSSLVTLYAMVGLVSGVYARPTATSKQRYIRTPQSYRI